MPMPICHRRAASVTLIAPIRSLESPCAGRKIRAWHMKRSFWSLIAVQVQVLLNDNAAKLMLMALGVAVAPELVAGPLQHTLRHMTMHGRPIVSAGGGRSGRLQAKLIKTVLAALILLPFVLFSPTAGWISDRFAKRDVIVLTMWAQFAIMALIFGALIFHLILGGHLRPLPAGHAVRDLFARQAGHHQGDRLVRRRSGAPSASSRSPPLPACCSAAWSAAALFRREQDVALAHGHLLARGAGDHGRPDHDGPGGAHRRLPDPADVGAHQPAVSHSELLWEHFAQLKDVWRDPPVRLCVLGIAYFYGLAGALYLTLFEVSASIHLNGLGHGLADRGVCRDARRRDHPGQLSRHAADHAPGGDRPHSRSGRAG